VSASAGAGACQRSFDLVPACLWLGLFCASELAARCRFRPVPIDRRKWAGMARCGGPALGFVKTVYFLRKPEQWHGRLVLQICDRVGTAAMPGMTTIYDPPKEGLPYLVVTFTPLQHAPAACQYGAPGVSHRLRLQSACRIFATQ
jgi:hypothetical protein